MTDKKFSDWVKEAKKGKSISCIASEIYAHLTEDERLQLLYGSVPFWQGIKDMMSGPGYNAHPYVMGEIKRIGFPGIRFIDGPRGVATGIATAFPVSMARGATWDTQLEEEVGQAIGEELRASGGNFFGGVCINLPRTPAWGRAQETYSDEPIVLGKMGSALTKGVQKNAMACVKHYALNSMENSRFKVNVEIDEKTLHERYLPHFKKTVQSGAMSVMSAYNSVNGEWAGQNKVLLTEILRDIWGFDGFVITDFIWGMRDPAKSLNAGLDIEAPFAQQRPKELKKRIENGETSWEAVKKSGLRVIKTVLKYYSQLEEEKLSKDVICSQEHISLARKVAARSITLLKNNEIDGTPLLPFVGKNSKIVVAGRLANVENTGDNGSSSVKSPYVVTAYEGILRQYPNSKVVLVGNDKEALRREAPDADLVICVVGYTAKEEGEYVDASVFSDAELTGLYPKTSTPEEKEIASIMNNNDLSVVGGETAGGDRSNLELPKNDVEIINLTSSLNEKVVVAVVTAGAVIVNEWVDKVPALLFSWYAGMEGGNGLADVLSGKISPTGHLPYPIPKDASQVPEMQIDAEEITYSEFYGQRFIDKNHFVPEFPLGFGLSYTNFEIKNFEVLKKNDFEGTALVDVKNTGYVTGGTVVQIYGQKVCDQQNNCKELLGFNTVTLAPGETQQISFDIDFTPFASWNIGEKRFEKNSGKYVLHASQFSGDKNSKSAVINLGE